MVQWHKTRFNYILISSQFSLHKREQRVLPCVGQLYIKLVMMKMDYVFGLTILVHACKRGKHLGLLKRNL